VRGLGRHFRDSLAAFRSVFQNVDLRRLQLAWAAAIIGHWAYAVAVNVYAYNQGGATAVGVLVLIRMVPAALLAPFAATLADRYPRDRMMLASNLVRATVVGIAAAGVLVDVAPEVVYALAAIAMLVGTPFRPAMAAITPSITRTPGELTAANAVASTIGSIAFFAGPALAGVLLGFVDAGYVFFVTVFGFVLSAFFVQRLELTGEAERTRDVERSNIASETLVGFKTVLADARLRILIGLFSAQTLVAGVFLVLVVVTAIELLDMGDSGVGYLNSAFGVGALAGSILALSLVGLRRLSPPFILGVLMWGAPLIVIGVWANPVVALVLLAVIGIGNSLVDVSAFTLIQRAVPEQVMARVFGVIQMLWVLTVGLGGLIAVPLIDGLGAKNALIATGAFLPALVLAAGPRLLSIDAAATVPGPELSLLRSTPIFAPLPGTALEHLATRLTALHLEPGTVVVREGDAGDRFYVVVEGELDVTSDSRQISTMGPGESFGEIALLRDLPRTATVIARTPVVLYALDRDDFLAAVTGHAPSAEAAEQVVSARLAGAPVAAQPVPDV
jgi:MFS family permease